MARTKTNFQVAEELQNLYNENYFKQRFILDSQREELERICEIQERSLIEIQDLRDFLVIYFSDLKSEMRKQHNFDTFDEIDELLSLITFVLDCHLIK